MSVCDLQQLKHVETGGLCHPRPKDMKGQWDHDPSPENGTGGT